MKDCVLALHHLTLTCSCRADQPRGYAAMLESQTVQVLSHASMRPLSLVIIPVRSLQESFLPSRIWNARLTLGKSKKQ